MRNLKSIRSPARLAILTTLSLLPIAATAQDSAPAHAGAEDCAAMVAILQYARGHVFDAGVPMAATSYGMDCDWKALGFAPSAITSATPEYSERGLSFSFANPVTPNDGKVRDLQFTLMGWNRAEKGGLYQVEKCTAQKQDGRWQFLSCRTMLQT